MLTRFAAVAIATITLACTRPSGPAVQPQADEPQDAPTDAPSDEAPVAIAPELNAKYLDQTDPKVWQKRFEREGREAHDRKAEIIAALEIEPGLSIADVGAGTGLFTVDFAKRVGAEGSVVAVEVHDFFIEHLNAKFKAAGLDNAKTIKATQRSANIPEASVDLIFLCAVYHHIEYPQTYLASLHAALRPGGRLVVIDYKAIKGESKAWVLEHVRASPDAFKSEIETAGFAFKKEHQMLAENFFFEFTRP